MGKQFENVLRMPGGMPRHLNIFQNALSIVTPERDPKRLLQGVGMLNLRGKAGNFRLFSLGAGHSLQRKRKWQTGQQARLPSWTGGHMEEDHGKGACNAANY